MKKLELTKQETITSGGHKKVRWFTQTDDGFDGTSQGFGFKSAKNLYKAYYYFLNRDKYQSLEEEVIEFLKTNPYIKKIMDMYMTLEEQKWRGEEQGTHYY